VSPPQILESEMLFGDRRRPAGQIVRAVFALRPNARRRVGGKYPEKVASEVPLQDHRRPVENGGAQM
jgi:hypothetical protein